MKKTIIQVIIGVVLAVALAAATALVKGGGYEGADEALASIDRHVQKVYGAGDETEYQRESAKAGTARNYKDPAEGADQCRVFGYITGSPRRDEWPDEWRTHPEYAQQYGGLFRVDTGDMGGDRIVWLVACKEQLPKGGYILALGDVVVASDGIVAIDPRFKVVFNETELESQLTQKSFEYFYNTEFDKVLLAKFHDLFPDVVRDPNVDMNAFQKVVAYVKDSRNALPLGVCALIALLVALAAGSYLPNEEADDDELDSDKDKLVDPPPVEPPADGPELCPYHNEPLINGECPHGCTITRCSECGAIMKDGKCPRGCREPEVCPSCGSDILPDGSCPNGCTIIRCTECNSIMKDGVCPKGCNADPLHFGWAGSTRPDMTVYALEVVTPEEYAGFQIDVPDVFVVGRSAIDAKESFLELLVLDNALKQQCSRRYVQFKMLDDGTGFYVSMLKNHNFAYVNNHKITREGETEILRDGETIRLNPNFELKLVQKEPVSPAAEDVGGGENANDGERAEDAGGAERAEGVEDAGNR